MYEYKCRIIDVIDGDTIDVDIDLGFDFIMKNQRIRLFGIDTPELRTSDPVEKIFGTLAKNAVENFINGSHCVLRTHEYNPKGKFGRILGDIIVNNKSLVELLVEKHLGVPYFGQSKELIEEKHLENREFLFESGVVPRP